MTKGQIIRAGGGTVTILVDRDTESYPEVGIYVSLVGAEEQEQTTSMIDEHDAEQQATPRQLCWEQKPDEFVACDRVASHKGWHSWQMVGYGEPVEKSMIRLCAEIIAGLQAPYSLDRTMLGAAGSAWSEAFRRCNAFGWTDADGIEEGLAKQIGADIAKGLLS